MPNRKLTELPTLNIAQFDSSDLLYIVDTGASDAEASKKITYANLVGNEIIRLDTTIEAFSAENVGDITFLSGAIITNETNINGLTTGAVVTDDAIDGLSAIVDQNFALFETLSTDVGDLDISEIVTSVNALCSYVELLNIENDDLYITKNEASRAYNYTTGVSGFDLVLSGNKIGSADLDTSANTLATAVNELHGEINTNTGTINTNTGAIDLNTSFRTSIAGISSTIDNIRTLSGFSGTVTTAGVTQTKHVPIKIGSTIYKLLLAD